MERPISGGCPGLGRPMHLQAQKGSPDRPMALGWPEPCARNNGSLSSAFFRRYVEQRKEGLQLCPRHM